MNKGKIAFVTVLMTVMFVGLAICLSILAPQAFNIILAAVSVYGLCSAVSDFFRWMLKSVPTTEQPNDEAVQEPEEKKPDEIDTLLDKVGENE